MSAGGIWEVSWSYWMADVAWPGLVKLASGAAGTHGHIPCRCKSPGDPDHQGVAHQDMLISTHTCRHTAQ